MDLEKLFSGVAVVIDDEVGSSETRIGNIVKQIQEKSIPILAYDSLPKDEEVNHFQNLSFLLLDWRLVKNEITEEDIQGGVSVPDGLQEYDATENLAFIEKLSKICFCPIFIFTNENEEGIILKLVEAGLYKRDRPNYILVKSKADLQENSSLFSNVENWLRETPSIYVLKEWECAYQQAKNTLFSEFQCISPSWPTVLWNTFGNDGGNNSIGLGEVVFKNLFSRMTPYQFEEEIISISEPSIARNEIRLVLEGERFLTNLHPKENSTGDLYKDTREGKVQYWLNIRAQCDLVRDSNPLLYCLLGEILTQKPNGNIEDVSFSKGQGQYIEKVYHAIVPFIDGGRILEIKFVKTKIVRRDTFKRNDIKRIGRLLPPYINRIQQRYALYLHRQGLPRIPSDAIFGTDN